MRRSRRGSGSAAPDLGLASVAEDAQRPDVDEVLAVVAAAADRGDAGEDLADVDRLADDVVDAGFEQHQRVLKRVMLAECDDRGRRAVADAARREGFSTAIADQEGADRLDIVIGGGVHPLAELA
jgi:hypothetical protein